jgi:hypothetical protein
MCTKESKIFPVSATCSKVSRSPKTSANPKPNPLLSVTCNGHDQKKQYPPYIFQKYDKNLLSMGGSVTSTLGARQEGI